MPARGRRSRYAEFFKTWHDLSDLTVRDFAERCGKQTSNMSSYLSGKVTPSRLATRHAIEHLGAFMWPVMILHEMQRIPRRQAELPTKGGLYVLFDSAGDVVYIGKAKSFRSEVWQALRKPTKQKMRLNHKMKKEPEVLKHISRYMSLYRIDSAATRANFEALLLRVIPHQTHNKNVGHFKK
jgi:hypothetical protein